MMILSGASLAIAGPLRQREPEVDVVVNVVTDIVEYTVYATSTAPAAVYTPPVANVVVTVTVQPTTTPVAQAPNVEVAAATSSSSTEVAASSTSSAASTASPTDFADIAVWHHNIHRANNSAPDVTYSDTLAGFAAQLSAGCVFEHDV